MNQKPVEKYIQIRKQKCFWLGHNRRKPVATSDNGQPARDKPLNGSHKVLTPEVDQRSHGEEDKEGDKNL